MDNCAIKLEWGTVPLESWGQIHISWDYTSVKERVHTISDIVLSDGRWVGKWVISVVLGQDSLGVACLPVIPLADSELLQIDVTYATLTPSIGSLVRFWESKFIPNHVVTKTILWVTCQEGILQGIHLLLNRNPHILNWPHSLGPLDCWEEARLFVLPWSHRL